MTRLNLAHSSGSGISPYDSFPTTARPATGQKGRGGDRDSSFPDYFADRSFVTFHGVMAAPVSTELFLDYLRIH